jgi:hypothetical protein
MREQAIAILVLGFGGLAACANDPTYLTSPNQLEAGVDDGTGTGTLTEATDSLMLPIKPETTADAATRNALAAKLGVMVPYVKVGDLDIEVEYTIQNLDTMPGQAKVELDGANEWFVYDPSVIVLDPGNDEAPPTPGLQGDVPIDVPAMTTVTGVFREDQLLEAAVDLDQITRGNVNPFRATLQIDKNDPSFQPLSMYVPPAQPGEDPPPQTPVGPVIPRAAFANIVRVDVVFKPDHHMVMSYVVRVRDHRGILHDMGLAAPAGQIVMFAPTVFMP